jgi:plasmid stabilization system protein ParE
VEYTAELLSHSPGMGIPWDSAGSKRGMRRLPVSGAFDKWIIFYTHSRTALRIHRVFHGSQNIPVRFRRM